MAGVYGEFLGFFPELMETFDVYELTISTGDNLAVVSEAPIRHIRGIKQDADDSLNGRGGAAKNMFLVEPKQGVLTIGHGYVLWTYDVLDIYKNLVRINGQMYRASSSDTYTKEGGFYRYDLRAFIGTTSSSKPLAVKEGVW